jgi:hypothetical protein
VDQVCYAAASVDGTDVLDYVIEQGEVLEAEVLQIALVGAGSRDQLQAKWFRQFFHELPLRQVDLNA